ncbi:hypothetical protein STAS_21682, partial [Striga asiatica]
MPAPQNTNNPQRNTSAENTQEAGTSNSTAPSLEKIDSSNKILTVHTPKAPSEATQASNQIPPPCNILMLEFSNKSPPPVNEQIMDFSMAATQQQPTITPENTTIKGQKRTWTRRQAKLAGASPFMGPPKAEIQERSKRVRQEEAGGGLLVFWNMEVDIHQIFCQPFCIEIEFSLKANTHRSWFAFVYLSPCRATRVLNVFRSASDHNLLFLHTGITQNRRKKAFCFDKRWLKQPGIKEEIQNVWAQPVTGSAMFTLSEKIKATRVTLLKW